MVLFGPCPTSSDDNRASPVSRDPGIAVPGSRLTGIRFFHVIAFAGTFSCQTLHTALDRCLDHFESKKMSKCHIVTSYLMTSQKRGIQIV